MKIYLHYPYFQGMLFRRLKLQQNQHWWLDLNKLLKAVIFVQ
jgi:hypothetical protein